MVRARYYCEICGKMYSSREEAEKCEAQGRPQPRFRNDQTVYLIEIKDFKPEIVDVVRICYPEITEGTHKVEYCVQSTKGDYYEYLVPECRLVESYSQFEKIEQRLKPLHEKLRNRGSVDMEDIAKLKLKLLLERLRDKIRSDLEKNR